MSDKLISADKLIQFVENWGKHRGREEAADSFLYAINNAPAVDAVEVVRCYQCVNNPGISTRTKGMVWCRKFRSEVSPSGFCSYGERNK